MPKTVWRIEYETCSIVIRPASTVASDVTKISFFNHKGMENALFEMSRISSIINNNDLAKLCTKSKLSLCDLFKSLSNVNSVIPIIPFIGVLISCDMFAKNSLLLRLANSAASLAAVFFCIESLRLNTI